MLFIEHQLEDMLKAFQGLRTDSTFSGGSTTAEMGTENGMNCGGDGELRAQVNSSQKLDLLCQIFAKGLIGCLGG